MSIDLFGVRRVLDRERKDYMALKKARERALRKRGTVKDAIEGANSVQESDLQPEAQRPSSQSESP